MSNDGGSSWIKRPTTGDENDGWIDITCSADGVHIVAARDKSSDLWISSDSGSEGSWVKRAESSGRKSYDATKLNFGAIMCDTTCMKIATVASDAQTFGEVQISSDRGLTWPEYQYVGAAGQRKSTSTGKFLGETWNLRGFSVETLVLMFLGLIFRGFRRPASFCTRASARSRC